MDLGISGRTAVITGGASGIGRATAKFLVEADAKVILIDIKADAVQEAARALGATALVADLSKASEISALPDRVRETGAMPDILLSIAGVTGAKGDPLTEITDEDWHEAWETDFMSVVRTFRAFVPPMAERGWGRAVAITSENAAQPYWEEAVYNTAKAAILNFAKGLSRGYAKKGVLINTVSPAFIETPMTDMMMDEKAEDEGMSRDEAVRDFLKTERPHLALERRGRPDEVAATIAFLCSEHASFVNGANWRVDGGSVATVDT